MGGTFTATESATEAQDIHVVLAGGLIFHKTMSVWHPNSNPKTDKALAVFKFKYDIPQEDKDLLKTSIVKIWDFYKNRLGYDLGRLPLPIRIDVLDKGGENILGQCYLDSGLIELFYLTIQDKIGR